MLFEPLKVGALQLKNRVVVPPMADFGLTGPDGRVNDRHLAHYGAFAKGGAGLVITEACAVSRVKDPQRTPIILWEDGCLPGMTALANAIHEGGAAAMVQLIHPGLATLPYERVEDILAEEMAGYAADFVAAAERCKNAGFDGVELHAAHGYFLNQVTELAGDYNYVCAIVRDIKGRCGRDFAVAVRFGEKSPETLAALAKALEAAGADLLDVSDGIDRNWDIPADFPYNRKVWLAKCVKPHVKVPVITVGRIFDGETAEGILRAGHADLAAVGRGHLCDPAWASKVQAGQALNPCRQCKTCLWYTDGRLCPARKTETPLKTYDVGQKARPGSLLKKWCWLLGVFVVLRGVYSVGAGLLTRSLIGNLGGMAGVSVTVSAGWEGLFGLSGALSGKAADAVASVTGSMLLWGLLEIIAGVLLALWLKHWGEKAE